jgi:hypothetical protein
MTAAVERDRPRPVMVRVDELVVSFPNETGGRRLDEVPVIFDTEGDRIVMLVDLTAQGGPVFALGMQGKTGYAVAMNVLQMRRRLLRAAKAQTTTTHRSEERP